MKPQLIAASLLLPACILEGEIGSNERLANDGGPELIPVASCTDDCEVPGTEQWSASVPLERPLIMAHSTGELVLVGVSDKRVGEFEDEDLQLLRMTTDGEGTAQYPLDVGGSMNLDVAEVAGGNLAIASGRSLSVVTLDGETKWSRDVVDPELDILEIYVETDDEGSIYVGATPIDANHEAAPLLSKYDAEGDLQWTRTAWPSAVVASAPAFSWHVAVRAIARDADGHLVACGQGVFGGWIGKFDRETGAELWSEATDRWAGAMTVLEPGLYLVSAYSGYGAFAEADGYIWEFDEETGLGFNHLQRASSSGSVGVASIFADSEGNGALFHSIDPSDGSFSSWSHDVRNELGDPGSGPHASIATAGEHMYAVFGEFKHPARVMSLRLD